MVERKLTTAEKILPTLIKSVHERLTKKFFRFKTVTLEVRLQNGFKDINKSKSFHAANDDLERIRTSIYELFDEIKSAHPNEPLRKVAVRVSNFEKYDPKQKFITDFF